jgi:adenylosuccinate synthase
MNAVVIGLGFGDEGKGLTTDFLVRQLQKTGKVIVVRFSGGQQAGHTVVSKNDGVSHVFSNFGSGTLAGASTYWSKFCTVDPVGVVRESNILREKGARPLLYIDEDCPVTTPYDKIDNQLRDRANGTCGTGFGSTLKREENWYSLKAGDLKFPSILDMKLEQIRKYYDKVNPEIGKIAEAHMFDFLNACASLRFSSNFVIQKSFPYHKHIVFEGSQGLMLDMNHGIFPHVTRSKTDTTNVPEILKSEDFEIYLVTRAYQTRHGNGPMTNEKMPISLKNTDGETNQLNEFQGTFRKSILDLDLLKYVIQKDPRLCEGHHNVNLVVTCLDQLENYVYTEGGAMITLHSPSEFVNHISTRLGIQFNKVYYSESPDSKNMMQLP